MKLEDIRIEITDEALRYITKKIRKNSGVIVSFNEVINWCGSNGEWIAVSVQEEISQYAPESYIKTQVEGIDILFHMDAYFMVSGMPKLTIAISHTAYGDFLTIKEFDPSFN